MQAVRVTITTPAHLHEELRHEAFQKRKSLSRIVVEKVKSGSRQSALKQTAARDFAMYDRIGKTLKPFRVVESIRAERDRNGQ